MDNLATYEALKLVAKLLSGIRSFDQIAYVKPGRLEDVMALTQVLALDHMALRTESGVVDRLQGKPNSGASWTEVAKEHPEFFRVATDGQFRISLVSRFLTSEQEDSRPPLSQELTQNLIAAAIDIHDRQIKRSERWTYLIPIWVALIGAIAAVIVKIIAD